MQLQVGIGAVDTMTYEQARGSDKYDEAVKNIKTFVQEHDSLGAILPRIRVSYVMTPEHAKNSTLFRQQ
jgi:hypothetical protein